MKTAKSIVIVLFALSAAQIASAYRDGLMLARHTKLMFLVVRHFSFSMLILCNAIPSCRRSLRLLTVCALAAVPFVAQSQDANRGGTNVVSVQGLGRTSVFMSPDKRYTIEVAQDPKRVHEDFPEDWLVLKVMDQNNRLVATKSFYSTYQKFHIYVADLGGGGQKEFLFTLGQGRGTSARRETLDIERFDGSQFMPVLTTPLSDFYASGKRWWYAIEFKAFGGGTTGVLLRLHTDNDSVKNLAQAGIPAEQTKLFKWQTNGGSGQIEGEFEIQTKATK